MSDYNPQERTGGPTDWSAAASPMPSPNVQQTMQQMTDQMQAVIEAAERAAEAIRFDAEEQARRHLAEAQRKADRLTAERVGLISELTDDLMRHASTVRDHSEQMIRALEDAITSVTEKLDQPGMSDDFGASSAGQPLLPEDPPGVAPQLHHPPPPPPSPLPSPFAEAAAPPPPPPPPIGGETSPAWSPSEPAPDVGGQSAFVEDDEEADILGVVESAPIEAEAPSDAADDAEESVVQAPPPEESASAPAPSPPDVGSGSYTDLVGLPEEPPEAPWQPAVGSAPPPPPPPPEGLAPPPPPPPDAAPPPPPEQAIGDAGASGSRIDDPASPPIGSNPLDEVAVSQEALQHATRMAMAGEDRDRIAEELRREYGIANPDPIVDRVVGDS